MALLRQEVLGQIWVQERSLWFGGVKLRSRSTVVKMQNGSLWLHSPAEPTAELCRELDALGDVAWIVVPNRFHHLHAASLKAKYPRAQIIAPASVRARNSAVIIDHDIGNAGRDGGLSEFRPLALSGVPFLDETLFFHEPSQSLIAADLMMCGDPKDHWTWRWVSHAFGQYGKFKLPPDVRMHTKPSPELRASLDALLKLPMARILIAHSDTIHDRPAEQLGLAWDFAMRGT